MFGAAQDTMSFNQVCVRTLAMKYEDLDLESDGKLLEGFEQRKDMV